MSVEKIVNEVKARVEGIRQKIDPLLEQGQGALKAGVESLKASKTLVSESAQALIKTGAGAGRDLIEAAQEGVAQARERGIKDVIAHPSDYVAKGAARAKTALKETAELVTKTGGAVGKTLRQGYAAAASEISATKSHKQQATARKAAVKAKKSAKAAKAAVGAQEAHG